MSNVFLKQYKNDVRTLWESVFHCQNTYILRGPRCNVIYTYIIYVINYIVK